MILIFNDPNSQDLLRNYKPIVANTVFSSVQISFYRQFCPLLNRRPCRAPYYQHLTSTMSGKATVMHLSSIHLNFPSNRSSVDSQYDLFSSTNIGPTGSPIYCSLTRIADNEPDSCIHVTRLLFFCWILRFQRKLNPVAA
jgi:hypothetical protein